jgi:hypothetical protein
MFVATLPRTVAKSVCAAPGITLTASVMHCVFGRKMGDRSFLAPDCPPRLSDGMRSRPQPRLSPNSLVVRTLVSSSSSSTSRKNNDADSLQRRTKRYTRLELLTLLAGAAVTPHARKRRHLQKVMQTHSVSQLKKLCQIRGLSLKGQKIDIAERLYDDLVQQDFLAGGSNDNHPWVHDSDDTDSDLESESSSGNIDSVSEDSDAETLQNDREIAIRKSDRPDGNNVTSIKRRYADRTGIQPNEESYSHRIHVERSKNLARHLRTHNKRRETAHSPLGARSSRNVRGAIAVETGMTTRENPSSAGTALSEPLLFRGRPIRRIIQCPVCQQQFRDQKGLTMHVSRKPACRYAMSCPDCFQHFTTRQGLQLHVDHRTEKCPIHKPRSLASIFRHRP